MRFVMFYHSLVSDWNHGNAHFLRGIATELIERGHPVDIFEPFDSWSRTHLIAEQGEEPLSEFCDRYPRLRSTRYNPIDLDLDCVLKGVDTVIVHEWNSPDWIARLGEHRRERRNYRLLFHDTHHRSVTDPDSPGFRALENYDGVLAFGASLRRQYFRNGWSKCVWIWHEAADTRVFKPHPASENPRDLVWIGNWGDDERTQELHEFLLEPVRALALNAAVYGVRYPAEARAALSRAGIDYRGWIPNFRVPETFAQYRATVHIPRRPYTEQLPGIPTIRVFEAMACGIPLVCAPWEDQEHLFRPGEDYLIAKDGAEMQNHLSALREDPRLRQTLADNALATIQARHTCAHRTDELLEIVNP